MGELWHDFINGEASRDNIEPVILRSWQRSMGYQIAPEKAVNNELLPAIRLRERCQQHEDLIRAGQPVLPDIFNLLQGSNYIALLCDLEGYILESLGDPPFMSKAQQVYLSPGASWREEIKGTNAIGTALTENSPVKVLGWEHFVKENHFLACWAAPIRNLQGETVGVLDISGDAGNPNHRTLEIVVMAARMIEQNLQLLELNRNFQLVRQGITVAGELLREGFLAIDSQGLITEINQTGAALLGRKREEVIGHSANEVFRSSKGWVINNEGLDVKLSEDNGEVLSRLRQITDASGKTMGAVGVLQPLAKETTVNSFWVGNHDLTKQTFERAGKAASTNSSVLITGESGTGKEVLARYIHESSPRAGGPFIALNCAALPPSLIESELFGYSDGAFTGARRGGQAGKFELAHGGTIFLDEIGDMPHNVQVTLLRVLQEREVLRIGDTKPRKIDVRVVAATHKNLPALVSGNLFRLDLFYRLKVVSIEIPPLRQRQSDIRDLVPYFVNKFCKAFGKPLLGVAEAVYQCLMAHSWPGNVRELENCIESMVAMSDSSFLGINDLPPELRLQDIPTSEPLLNQQTKQAIIQALNQTAGKIAPAAKLLGIGRNTLYRKIKEFHIEIK